MDVGSRNFTPVLFQDKVYPKIIHNLDKESKVMSFDIVIKNGKVAMELGTLRTLPILGSGTAGFREWAGFRRPAREGDRCKGPCGMPWIHRSSFAF